MNDDQDIEIELDVFEEPCRHHWIQIPGSYGSWHDHEFWRMRCEFCGKVIECEN